MLKEYQQYLDVCGSETLPAVVAFLTWLALTVSIFFVWASILFPTNVTAVAVIKALIFPAPVYAAHIAGFLYWRAGM